MLEDEKLPLIVDGDGVRRLLPSRFIISGLAKDLRALANKILSQLTDEEKYTHKDIIISDPIPVDIGSCDIAWNERMEN